MCYQVVSPFQAILDYEIANKVPIGWVNYSIHHTSPNGAWHRLERGEIPLDANFFAEFNCDLRHHDLWKAFHAQLQQMNPQSLGTAAGGSPPLPRIDAEFLYWEMMRVSTAPDPYMYPALQKLKASGQFLMGALSNTTIIPDGHPYSKGALHDVKSYFDFFISSAHTGLRKPDPRIYELALKEMNDLAKKKGISVLVPNDIVFLDDIGINLKWAAKLGMRTLKVNLGRTQEAVEELEKITGLHLLESEGKARL